MGKETLVQFHPAKESLNGNGKDRKEKTIAENDHLEQGARLNMAIATGSDYLINKENFPNLAPEILADSLYDSRITKLAQIENRQHLALQTRKDKLWGVLEKRKKDLIAKMNNEYENSMLEIYGDKELPSLTDAINKQAQAQQFLNELAMQGQQGIRFVRPQEKPVPKKDEEQGPGQYL